MEAKSVVCRSIVTVKPKDSVKDVAAKMRNKNACCAVVVEKKEPVGIFSDTELLELLDAEAELSTTDVGSVMLHPIVAIRENQPIFTALRQKGIRDFWRFAVVDAAGRVNGVITEKEIIHKFALLVFPHNMMLASLKNQGLTATPATPIKKIIKMLVQSRQNCVTILKGRKPAGILTERSLAKMTSKTELNALAGKKMTKRIMVAKAGSSVREAVIKMIKMDQLEIVVTDEDGNYYGIVTQTDLVKHVEKIRL